MGEADVGLTHQADAATDCPSRGREAIAVFSAGFASSFAGFSLDRS
jgi:hypothetical protein